MEKATFNLLIDQFITDTISEDGKRQFLEMLENPENKAVLEAVLRDAMITDKYEMPLDQVYTEQLIGQLKEKIQVDNKPKRIQFLQTVWVRYAAAVLVIAGIGAYLWRSDQPTEQQAGRANKSVQTALPPGRDRAILTLATGEQIDLDSTAGNIVQQGNLTVVNSTGKLKYEGSGTGTEFNTISTPRGGQYQVVLPDGTRVWLNAASSIKFPTAFTGNSRQVQIKGEAYLEVVKNTSQPFVVVAGETEIQVLGTSFNVKAYPDESETKTTLVSGGVKVKSKLSDAVILKPGQQAVAVDQQKILVKMADVPQTLAWKNGIFNFENASLKEVMKQLERWYDLEVVYPDGVPEMHFVGEMRRSMQLSDVLTGLSGARVHFKLEGRKLIVLL